MLHLKDLRKGFRTPDGAPVTILDIPAFELAAAEQVALAGGSGTGKTTLLNIIAGVLTPDQGSVTIDGTDIAQLSEAARDAFRGQHIGYVYQTFNLLDGYSALENVLLAMTFGGGVDEDRARALLQRLGMGERLHYRPGQLSTGQRQRVAIARAVANKPKLVLADEPTGNLDPRNAREALALLQEACRSEDAALLLVSHDEAILQAFPRTERLDEVNAALSV